MNLILTAKKQKIRELTIYVESGIGSCPFACEYCFVAKRGEHRVMTRQMLMDCVDFLRRVCEKPKALRFFGTEPLTQFGLIQHARAYAPDLEISITTNGWLLNDERIQWLADNDVRIYVYSIDGGPEHHKARRTTDGRETWERVAENFQKLLPSQGKWITARGTWAPSDYDLVGRFTSLEAIGAQSIQIVPVVGSPHWNEAEVAGAYMALADYYGGGDCPSRFIKQALERLESGDTRIKQQVRGRKVCVGG
jgi:sulfatase maturation enzyme AslB (radical SAM superfamily)